MDNQKAAIVEEKLPYVRPDPTICKRCGFKKYCQEGESLEKAKPLPLIHAIAYQEAEKELEKLRRETLKLPEYFWHAYFTLKKEAESGDAKALEKIKVIEEFRMQRDSNLREKERETLFKVMPNEFEEWGGMVTLKNHYTKISRTANMLFPRIEDEIREIIRVARKNWDI